MDDTLPETGENYSDSPSSFSKLYSKVNNCPDLDPDQGQKLFNTLKVIPGLYIESDGSISVGTMNDRFYDGLSKLSHIDLPESIPQPFTIETSENVNYFRINLHLHPRKRTDRILNKSMLPINGKLEKITTVFRSIDKESAIEILRGSSAIIENISLKRDSYHHL